MPGRTYWLCALFLIAMMGAIQVTTVRDETATFDEPVHLAAGYSYWATGRYEWNPEHPPLMKLLCALPLRLFYNLRLDTESPEWKNGNAVMVGNLFLYRNTTPPDPILFAGRLVTIGLSLLFGLYLAWWTRRRLGAGVGLFAVSLYAFDPNLIAHGRYVTTDLAAAFFIFTTYTLWIEYLLEPRWSWMALTGLSLGVALGSKFSTLYLPIVLIALAVLWRLRHYDHTSVLKLAGALAIVGLLSALVIAIVYWPEVWGSKEFPPPSFRAGLEMLVRHNTMGHPTYLLGQVSTQGWWYYFPVAFAVKTAAATVAGLMIAALLYWRSDRKFIVAALLMPAAVYFAIAMCSHINLGIRHVLPVYPFLYVASGCVLLPRARPGAVAFAMVALSAIESVAVYPDYMSFFNVLAGGPKAGPRYLLDSNLDWGQDFKKAGRYLNGHEMHKVCLAFFANVDFPQYGIHPESIPEGANADNLDCVAVVSATPLFGQYVGLERFRWLRARRPDAIIGHSIYIYDLRKASAMTR